MKMKNKTFTAILLLLIPLFLTACTLADIPVVGKYFGDKSGGGKITAPTTLNMWGLWETPDIMDVAFKSYQAQENLITINYEDRSVNKVDDYKNSVFTRLKQGEGEMPDIVLVHNSWVPFIKDYLQPAPSDVITAQDYSSKFYPVATESAVLEGQVYGIPVHHDGLVLVYNKDHFDEIDQKSPPTAWEEFRRIALALTKREEGGLVRAGAAIGAADNIDFFSDIVGLMIAQAGVSIPSGIDSKSAQDALSFYTLFLKSDGVWDTSLPEASKAFSAGKVSMIFVPTWNLLDIVKANPGMNIGVAPVPQAVAEKPVSWASFWMYVVPKSSSNSKAAWKFINYLSQDDQQLAIFNEASKYRPYGAPFASVSLASQAGQSASSQYVKPVINTASYAKSNFLSARSGNSAEVEALRTAVNAVISGQSAEEALKACKQTLSGIQR